MSLYRKYRPQDFSDMMGNKSTTDSIESVLKRKTIPSAWMFTGPSGCGKTTLARIVASRAGIADADLIELNIARFRGIENAREIQEQMGLSPIHGERRGWILDEVHMATKEFHNAMLKALEDTPKHVIFFLCTTDPQKIPKTVAGRCVRYQVETLSERKLERLLTIISKKEGLQVPVDVIVQIARDAYGSARVAINILEKIIGLDPKSMKATAEQAMLEEREAIELCRALIKGEKWKTIAEIVVGMGEFEIEGVRQLILAYCNSILLKGNNPEAWLIMDTFKNPFDRNGRPGFTMACYEAVEALRGK